jgi:predicted nucleotidyltransferase
MMVYIRVAVTLPDMAGAGSAAHQALIGRVAARYDGDARVRAVAVFGSVSTGAWHELSDVDLDVVTDDDAVFDTEAEARALFGEQAAIVIAHGDSADIVLSTLEEISIRWHPLPVTSPNITASLRVAAGSLSAPEIAAAGEANRVLPDEQRLLDVLVREAVGAWKAAQRGRGWEAVTAVERARHALTALRGRRDGLRLDPADPLGALTAVIAETAASFDLGPRRRALVQQLDLKQPPRPVPDK